MKLNPTTESYNTLTCLTELGRSLKLLENLQAYYYTVDGSSFLFNACLFTISYIPGERGVTVLNLIDDSCMFVPYSYEASPEEGYGAKKLVVMNKGNQAILAIARDN